MKEPTTKFKVRGMDCADEIATLREALGTHVDPERLSFDLLAGVMEVPVSVDEAVVIEAVAATGLQADPVRPKDDEPGPSWWSRHRRNVLVAASGLGVVLGFTLHALADGLTAAVGSEGMGAVHTGPPWPALFAYAVAVLSGLALVAPKAWYAARRLRPDMNLLMTLAVAGAIGLGEWFEAGTVSFLFALSLALEAWSVGRARRAIEKLLSLTPPTVRIRQDGQVVDVDPADVAVDTVFEVRAGERFGLDGVVVTGQSEVNQAPITGESRPVEKGPGNEVFAGTINGNGHLEVRSTRAAADTTLAQIVRMVGEARKDRSDAERWVERFARVYTPLVFGIAAVTMLVPPLLGGAWGDWFYRGLVLLVIGCPCALVIATPVAVVSGLAATARHGVLVKGGRFLEVPARLKVVALDKTGTLTEGRPRVVEVSADDSHTPDELLEAAAAIEHRSDHPLARAIVEYAQERRLRLPDATAVEIIPGKGVTGTVSGRVYWLGSHRWLEDRGQDNHDLHDELERRSGAGRSVVVVGTDDHVCGFITLGDPVRDDARAAVTSLHRVGIERIAMLTGDNQGTADAVATEVGIDDVHAELLPADKLDVVARLENEVGPVAMIGDGVNDAPALARAAIGVAMGEMGTDVALETADVALMTDDLTRLSWLVEHSRRTLSIIRQNTVFALAVKAVFVVLAFGGWATLWAAIAADMGASLLVVLNALRLLGVTADSKPGART